ncbi:hypothetical protein A3Q56_03166 [Intoshia linei]|uniref:AAA+ ATPase domain-containing protein n=1 Tax=Intoshia linei TaxID=1819745 RepID=A0A177B604_9BILA|nr:hypothetical protein A3Q56_03166 [Intoshia linei]
MKIVTAKYETIEKYKQVYSHILHLENYSEKEYYRQKHSRNISIEWIEMEDEIYGLVKKKDCTNFIKNGMESILLSLYYSEECDDTFRGSMNILNDDYYIIYISNFQSILLKHQVFYIHLVHNDHQFKNKSEALNAFINKSFSSQLKKILLGNVRHNISINYKNLPEDFSVEKICKLNNSQKMAVKSSMTTPVTIIQGPPGTGKTKTAATLIYHLSLYKGNILVCAPSNVAVDNLAEALDKAGVNVVRIFSRSARRKSKLKNLDIYQKIFEMYPFLKKYEKMKMKGILNKSENKILRNWYFKKLKKASYYIFQKIKIVCATCHSANNIMISDMTFNTVLIDESTLGTELDCLVPIVKGCVRLILVGDQHQLQPIIKNQALVELGYDMSMFERLLLAGIKPVLLDTQYRMHPGLIEFSAKSFYKNKLYSGISKSDRSNIKNLKWFNKNLPLLFWNTVGIEMMMNKSYYNLSEIKRIIIILFHLFEKGVESTNIGVISSYKSQTVYIKTYIDLNFPEYDLWIYFKDAKKILSFFQLLGPMMMTKWGFCRIIDD